MISHDHKCIFTHIPKTGGMCLFNHLTPVSDSETFGSGEAGYEEVVQKYHINHKKIKEIQSQIDQKTFDDYFKFTFVRNPWAKIVSLFFFARVKKAQRYVFNHLSLSPNCSFKDFVLAIKSARNHPHHPVLDSQVSFIYDIDDKECLDFIGRTENLQNDFDIICEKIGAPKKQLRKINVSKHKHYTEYYDEETKQIVAEKYAEDIEYFGYKFGE